jgi:chromosome segregation ATPase
LVARTALAVADGHMNDTDSIAIASRRLALALDALEAAAERRDELDRDHEALLMQMHALGADRSRLASELDHATARSRGLESANREVAQRIDQAIETISGVLTHDE